MSLHGDISCFDFLVEKALPNERIGNRVDGGNDSRLREATVGRVSRAKELDAGGPELFADLVISS